MYIKRITGYITSYCTKGLLDIFKPVTTQRHFMKLFKGDNNMAKKEMIIDVANERYLYGFYELLIKQLELPSNTGRNLGGINDFLEEPWEEDRVVRFINVSKTTVGIKNEIKDVLRMFEYVKEFQKKCGNEFTWTVEQ